MPFDKPLGRTRDTVDICRKVWSGDKVDPRRQRRHAAVASGSGDRARQAVEVHEPSAAPDIPIVIASIGPSNVEMTAEIADGWQPIHFVPDRFERVWGEPLRAGRAKRSAELGPLSIFGDAQLADRRGRGGRRRPRGGTQHDRVLRRRHGRQVEELLQRPLPPLRLGGRGREDPGPLPRRPARRGDGRGPRRVHRHRQPDRHRRAHQATPRRLRERGRHRPHRQPHRRQPARRPRRRQSLDRLNKS